MYFFRTANVYWIIKRVIIELLTSLSLSWCNHFPPLSFEKEHYWKIRIQRNIVFEVGPLTLLPFDNSESTRKCNYYIIFICYTHNKNVTIIIFIWTSTKLLYSSLILESIYCGSIITTKRLKSNDLV